MKIIFILDGNLEDVTHVWRLIFSAEKKIRFATAFDLKKCLNQIKLPISPHTYEPNSDIPSNIRTKPSPDNVSTSFGHSLEEISLILPSLSNCFYCRQSSGFLDWSIHIICHKYRNYNREMEREKYICTQIYVFGKSERETDSHR